MITLVEKIAKHSDVKRQTEHGQTELSNMLEEKRKVSRNLDELQNLLIELTVKASSERKRGSFMSFQL